MTQPNNIMEGEKTEKQWRKVYIAGGLTALVVIIGTILDIIIGTVTGGNLATIPQTAAARFVQFQDNWLLGLYNLDMLNFITTIFMLPTFFALCAAHRRSNIGGIMLATVIYFIGAAVFLTNNTALVMLELSNKYAAAGNDAQRQLLAAAGEALLARGAHGSLGAFPGFFLLSLGSIGMACGMFKGKIFSRTTSLIGVTGSSLLLVYIVLVTFIPEIKRMAMLIAAPGGILTLVWLIMIMFKLFGLGCSRDR